MSPAATAHVQKRDAIAGNTGLTTSVTVPLTMLVLLAPVRRAVRLRPVEALRHA